MTPCWQRMKAPNFILKIIPHVDGSPADLRTGALLISKTSRLKEAWTGPAALGLFPHALADVARLPVREVVSALHFKADLTLGPGDGGVRLSGEVSDRHSGSRRRAVMPREGGA